MSDELTKAKADVYALSEKLHSTELNLAAYMLKAKADTDALRKVREVMDIQRIYHETVRDHTGICTGYLPEINKSLSELDRMIRGGE